MSIDAAASRQFALVAKAIAFIRAHAPLEPTLEEIAAAVALSAQALQRVLADWAGISPQRFLHYLSRTYVRAQLAASADQLTQRPVGDRDSPERTEAMMPSWEAMTPDQIRAATLGIDIGYGFGSTPFGDALLAWTARGICHLAFSAGDEEHDGGEGETALLAELSALWPAARLQRDGTQAHALLQRIFSHTQEGVHVVLRGTPFQIRIWEALIRLQPGQLVSYGQLASALHAPRSSRAVGSAIAANSLGFLIPCHRMIRADGNFGEFRWGKVRKQAMIVWEAHRRQEGVHNPTASPAGTSADGPAQR